MSPKQLAALVRNAGGRIEEDEGAPGMRVFQACAPLGRIWQEGVLHFRVDWQRGTSEQAKAFNLAQFQDLKQRLASGHREMTDEEKDITASD